MTKIHVWSNDEARKILQQRLTDARDARKRLENDWRQAEKMVYSTKGSPLTPDLNFDLEQSLGISDGPDQGSASASINYTFKNLRYIHAQLSANPPSIVPRPTSNDTEDKRRADAADRIVRYSMKQYKLQDRTDMSSLNTLIYGSGFMKLRWDTDKGEILDMNEETGELVLEGDLSVSVPNIWNMFLDPDAETWEDVQFAFERILVPTQEALHKWPDKKEIIEKNKISNQSGYQDAYTGQESALKQRKYDVVELYEYWEKGSPSNGMLGRFCICTRDGTPVSAVTACSERYSPPVDGKSGKKARFEVARLPYILLTDIDVPSSVWGKSAVDYAAPVQDMLNRLDNVSLEIAQAHGIVRLLTPEAAEISLDAITDSTYDIVKYSGNIPPSYMNPAQMPSMLPDLMARQRSGIDDVFGVNDAMFGKQSREQSGFSMQYATNQGNMIRFRLLNKYRQFVEDMYKTILVIIQKHWNLPRTIKVLGKEKAFESIDIKGADIESGYDFAPEYGSSLSLDPTTRREEMMTLIPLFEKAGVESRRLMKAMKLNDLSDPYDALDLADDRQREIFDEMTATGKYIKPEDLQDHKNMLAYSYKYLMTSEFKYLEENAKLLIKQHVLEREQLAAGGPAAPGGLEGTPGPAPAGIAPEAITGIPPLPGPEAIQAPPLPV